MFSISTGHKFNYGKTSLISVNIFAKRCELIMEFWCKANKMHLPILGSLWVPLDKEQNIFFDMLRRLTEDLPGINSMIYFNARLAVIKVVTYAMPIFSCVQSESRSQFYIQHELLMVW